MVLNHNHKTKTIYTVCLSVNTNYKSLYIYNFQNR